MPKNILKICVQHVFSFILCISLIGVIVCSCTKLSWLNERFLISKLDKFSYSDEIYKKILDDYESIGIPSGIPTEVFAAALDLKAVKQDIEKCVKCLYTNIIASINTDSLRQKLNSSFAKYAESIGVDMNQDDVRGPLAELENYCVSQYEGLIRFPFERELSPIITRITKIANMALVVCIIAGIASIGGLFIVLRYGAIQYICSSIIGCGLTCIIPCAAVLASAPYKRINLNFEALYNSFVKFVESGLLPIMIVGICMTIMGIGTIIFISIKNG